jgi:hypothetical protein
VDEDEYDAIYPRTCVIEHEYEVFWVGSMPIGRYPDEGAFEAFMDDHRIRPFESYVGVAYDLSPLQIFWLYPNEDDWAANDRRIVCSLFDPENDRLTRSLRGVASDAVAGQPL